MPRPTEACRKSGFEGDWLTGLRHGDLFGRRMGQRVGLANDKGLEGEARIKRRAAHMIVILAHRHASVRADKAAVGAGKICRRSLWLGSDRLGTYRAAYIKIDAPHLLGFLSPEAHQQVPIMGLDPGFQKAGGNGKNDQAILFVFKFYAGKPAGKNVFAQLCPQSLLNAIPFFFAHFHRRAPLFGSQP